MRNYSLKKPLAFVFSLSLALSALSQTAFANVCLHPLEMAALLHGKSKNTSLNKRIEQAEEAVATLEEHVEREEEIIDDEISNLANAFKEDIFTVIKAEKLEKQKELAAEQISLYIEDQESHWDSEKEGYKDISWNINDDLSAYFKSRGKVNERAFCAKAATNIKSCKEAIAKLKKAHKRLERVRKLGLAKADEIDRLQEEQMNRELARLSGEESEEDTEADAPCFECIDELRELGKPTAGQNFGNILSILAGGAMSYFGYRGGRREARTINNLRARQGFDPISSAGLSWAGASLGLPFISNGIYGLAGGNSPFGSFACNDGFASGSMAYRPFGHYGMNSHASAGAMAGMHAGAQFASPYMNNMAGMQAGMQFGHPFAGPAAGMQFRHPFAGPMAGAQAGMQFGHPFAGPMAGAQAGMQFGHPFAGPAAGMQFRHPFAGPMAGMHAGMQFGHPFAGPAAGMQFRHPFAGPMAGMHAGAQFGNPMAGINLQAQYQQQQYAQHLQFQQQQLQARIQAQQAWLQHQQAIQKDWMQRQQTIAGLTQEIFKIRQQIQIVASGSMGGNAALGANSSSLSAGVSLGYNLSGSGANPGGAGPTGGPQHSPAPNTGQSGAGGSLPVVEGR